MAAVLGDPLGKVTISNFPTVKSRCASRRTCAGATCSGATDLPAVNDNLMELLILLDSFKRARPGDYGGTSYYGYARRIARIKGVCRSPPKWSPIC